MEKDLLGRKIAIHQIVKLKKWDDGESNTFVELTMKSNKQKILTFRTLEKEYERFIECVKHLNPEIQVN